MKETLGLFELSAEISRLENDVPTLVTSANVAQAEEFARKYLELLDRSDSAGDERIGKELRRVAQRLSGPVGDYVTRLKASALAAYAAGRAENGDGMLAELEALAKSAPTLVKMVRNQYEETVNAVRGAGKQ